MGGRDRRSETDSQWGGKEERVGEEDGTNYGPVLIVFRPKKGGVINKMSQPRSNVDLEGIEEWLNEEYNQYMSIYNFDDHVRLTNGSAGHYIDIYIKDDQSLTLKGERYHETISKSCNATRDALMDTLTGTI
jgi:hypothetical protein